MKRKMQILRGWEWGGREVYQPLNKIKAHEERIHTRKERTGRTGKGRGLKLNSTLCEKHACAKSHRRPEKGSQSVQKGGGALLDSSGRSGTTKKAALEARFGRRATRGKKNSRR